MYMYFSRTMGHLAAAFTRVANALSYPHDPSAGDTLHHAADQLDHAAAQLNEASAELRAQVALNAQTNVVSMASAAPPMPARPLPPMDAVVALSPASGDVPVDAIPPAAPAGVLAPTTENNG